MRLFVANVGVNAASASKRDLKSPMFPDGTFEFVPIKESARYAVSAILAYTGLKTVTGRQPYLAAYLPEKTARYAVHNDPEFETYTYGDIMTPRAANLQHIAPRDELWFLARLWDHDGAQWLGTSDFYFIGRFVVYRNEPFERDTKVDDIPLELRMRIKNNAHYRRLAYAGAQEAFRIIIGDQEWSTRFTRALKVTPEVVGHLYAARYDANEDVFYRGDEVLLNKSNDRPRRYSAFGSSTRAIQSFLDSSIPEEARSIETLNHLAEGCGST